MKRNIAREIAALQRMTPKELRLRYAEAFGEPTRSGNRAYLVKRIAWRLQSLAEGDLSARARRRAAELARDAEIRVTAPPTLNVHTAATAAHGAKGRVRPADAADPRLPRPGTILIRPYKGEEVRVTVQDDGFEYEGQLFRSLSAVAKAVTGTHTNGYLFFKLGKYA